MFDTRLECGNCGFVSPNFILTYLPDADSLDMVFQDQETFMFRVVTCDNVAQRTGKAKPSEEDLNMVEAAFEHESRRTTETRVNTWYSPDKFSPLICPQCHRQLVQLKLLAII